MSVNYVGVIVNTFEELEAVYRALEEAGYKTGHAESPENMWACGKDEVNFALAVDDERDILGVYDFFEGGDLVCTIDDVVETALSIFPL